MEYNPRISEAEWEVMKVIWLKESCTANEVVDALKDNKDWNPKTIKTLINRLLNKNIIGFEQLGKTYKYYPLVKEEDCMRLESKTFLQRIYNGSLKAMLVNFIEDNSLSKEEIDELKSILDERRKEI